MKMMYQSLLITLLFNAAYIHTDAMKLVLDAKNATDDGKDHYEITSGTSNAKGVGGIWSEIEIDITQDFTISAEVYLGKEKSDKSQGIAFVIQAIGDHHDNLSGNGRMGYANMNSVVAVEMDTFSNDKGRGTGLNNYDDIASDHMQIRYTDNVNGWFLLSDETDDLNTVAIGGDDASIEDGNYHPFTVEYNAESKIMKVYFDNTLMMTRKLHESGFVHYLTKKYLGTNNMATVGFTASDTGSNNKQKVRFNEDSDICSGAACQIIGYSDVFAAGGAYYGTASPTASPTAPLTPAPVAPAGYDLIAGSCNKGGNYDLRSGQTASSCAEICSDDAACLSFELYREQGGTKSISGHVMTDGDCYLQSGTNHKGCAGSTWNVDLYVKVTRGQCVGPTARWSGDPHFYTFDGEKYDCQGEGEFVVSKSLDSAFEVRGRFEKIDSSRGVTVTRGVAFNTGGVDEPTVSLTVLPSTDNTEECDLTMHVGGDQVPKIGGLDGIATVTSTTSSSSITYHTFEYMQTGVSVSITTKRYAQKFGCVMSVKVCLPPYLTDKEDIVGLLGTPDASTSDWMETDGTSLPFPTNPQDLVFSKAYDYCVENWCVRDSLKTFFTYNEGTANDFDYYDECSSGYDRTLEDLYNDADREDMANCDGEFDCEIETIIGGVESGNYLSDVHKGFDEIMDTPTEDQEELSVIYQGGNVKTLGPTTSPTLEPTTSRIADNDSESDSTNVIPGATSGVSGDPHFKTWDGKLYDFHGICDLVLLHNPDFEDGLSMDIHIRSKKILQWAYVSNIVIKISGDTFELSAANKNNQYWINGVLGEDDNLLDDATLLPTTIAGYQIRYRSVNSQQKEYTIDLGQGETITLKTWKHMVRIDLDGCSAENFASSVGLMGTFTHSHKVGRDNTTIIENLNQFGQEWQVLASEPKLFKTVEGPQAPSHCEIPSKTQLRRRLSESGVTAEEARRACESITKNQDFDLCVFDVMATGDAGVAGVY